MVNEKIICSKCGTENEDKYNYCKNCGNKLIKPEVPVKTDFFPSYATEQATNINTDDTPAEDNIESSSNEKNKEQSKPYIPNQPNTSQGGYNGYYNPNQYTQNAYAYGNTYVENIDGIPYGEVASFVGKKADKYMPVFSKMEITSSKIGWHWPAAVLGFFFGPLGAALWFFYRKMYKHAAVLTAIGAAITVLSTLFIAPASFSPADLIDALSGDTAALESIVEENSIGSQLASLLTDLADFACAVVCALFTHGWYKKHINRSIMKYRYSNVDPRYYQMGLMSIGGTSGGMLALGIGIMIFVENFASFLLVVLKFIGG